MKKLKTEVVIKNIARNLKKLRSDNKLTQAKISEDLHMERKGYQNLEYAANKDLKLSTIIKLMNYYRIGFRKLIK